MEHLFTEMKVEIRTNQERMETNQEMLTATLEAKIESKADAALRQMKTEIRTNQERTEAKIEASNENFKTLQGTLLSQMVIHQARTETIQEEMESKVNKNQEKMEAAIGSSQEEMRAAISSIRAKLEDVLMSLNHKTQGIRAEIEATKTLVGTTWQGLKAKIAEVTDCFVEGLRTASHEFKCS
jgi:hypothetical protein